MGWILTNYKLRRNIVMYKIKGAAAISLCLFLIISCATARYDCPLAGKWRSNEKATIEQMEKYGNLREEQRNIFSNIFGKVTLQVTCSEVTIYYDDTLVAKDVKYKIINRDGNLLEIKYYTPEILGGITTKRITLVGDCYPSPAPSIERAIKESFKSS
ncbi:MAG TPA: hypothetical protein VMV04_07210 [Thermodesulfobacteriota bacterium]|nr:hypothetical protein [Thermodesulfobacteriota bacterium]